MDQLVCPKCKAAYPLDDRRWKCDCGSCLDIEFAAAFPLAKIKSRKPTLWRYREAIPIKDNSSIVSFDEGFTPLLEVDIDGRSVLVKQDHLFPTGSYKDRGAAVLISKVKELGIKEVVEDSSGNAGCAIAAYCARAGVRSHIFVPADTAAAKSAQIQLYGAALNWVPGSREDTARAVLKAAEKVYYASHSWNPFFFHGTKTYAFEVCEQLGWKAPDAVILPVGNGTLLLGAAIGFRELLTAKVIKSLPKLIGIQSENCAPLYQAFRRNLKEIPRIVKKDTLAEGISIADPIRGTHIIDAVRESNGDFVIVSDAEIKDALKNMAKKGYYIEPTSAAAIAGASKYLAKSKDEVVVSVFTGHGLKSTEKMLKIVAESRHD
ncbi:MAG: threonine synthase [Deltaproteobacteria bacterium]|nr:threonine synthase [Deltaproteobacteria bacterium]